MCLVVQTSSLAQNTAKNMQNDLYYRLGKLNSSQNTSLSAKYSFQNFDSDDFPFYASSLYEQAHEALRLNHKDADFLLENFLSQFPNHPLATRANYTWGSKYFQRQNYSKAIHYLLQAPPQNLSYQEGQTVKLMLGKAYFYLSNDDDEKGYLDSANLYFSDLKANLGYKQKFYYDASYYSGYIHYTKGEYTEAVHAFRQAEESDTYKLSVPILIASVFYQQEEFYELTTYTEEVLADYQNYDQLDKLNLLTAESYYREEEFEDALFFYSEYFNLTIETPKPETYFQYGYTLYEAGDYEEAANKFKIVANLEDDSELAQYAAYYTGLCYLNNNEKYYAMPAFDKARSYDYDAEIVENATFILGQIYYDEEWYDDAINILEVRGSQSDDTRLNLSRSLINQSYLYTNNYKQSVNYLEQIPNKNFEQNRLYQKATFNQGVEYFNDEKFLDAIKSFEKSIFTPNAENNLSYETAYWLAESYSLQDYNSDEEYRDYLFSKAIPYYEEVIKFYSQKDSLYQKAVYGMGYALFNLKEYENAIPFFQQYSQLVQINNSFNYYSDSQLRLADCFYATRNYFEALKYYNIAISEEVADVDYAYFQRGMISQIMEERQNTLDSYDEIIENFPNSRYYQKSILQRGILNLDDSRYSVSIQDFTLLINDYPNSLLIPETLLNRGYAYEAIQDKNKAVDDFKNIIANYPISYQAQEALLTLQDLLVGREDEFSEYVTIFSNANPEPEATEYNLYNTALDTFLDEKYDQAISQLSDFIEKHPKSGLQFDAKFYLAEAYFLTDDRNSAMNQYLIVIQDKQSQFLEKAHKKYADLSFQSQDYQTALQYYTQLASITESKKYLTDSWLGITESYYEMAQYDSTLFFASIVLARQDIGGLQGKAQLYRGKANYQLGNYDQAREDFEFLTNNTLGEVGVEAQYLLAEVLYKKQDFEDSLDLLFELNQLFSAYEYWRGKAKLLIADNYADMNELFLAKATLESIIENSDDFNLVTEAQEKLELL